jgi:hypothetical protein
MDPSRTKELQMREQQPKAPEFNMSSGPNRAQRRSHLKSLPKSIRNKIKGTK